MFARLQYVWFERFELPRASRIERTVGELITKLGEVRIAFVKQDIQDDLYCCSRKCGAADIVFSTLMRSGPVALFTRLGAECLVVETEADPECRAWMEKAVDLGWYNLQTLEELRDAVPGRDYGQSAFAVPCETVDWSEFDIVISLDVAVPARITCQFPETLWCYYIREPKTKSYIFSQKSPLPGQDVFLNQTFDSRRQERKGHSLNFPYYLQYYGCFHELLNAPLDDSLLRKTVFLEHQTPEAFTADQLRQLECVGPLDSTSRTGPGDSFAHSNRKCQRKPAEVIAALMKAKYFISSPNHRTVWANAVVEAVASGSLVIGNPHVHVHRDLFSPQTSVHSFDELSSRLQYFESNPSAYRAEVGRQRRIVDYLCYLRPVHDLLTALARKRRIRGLGE